MTEASSLNSGGEVGGLQRILGGRAAIRLAPLGNAARLGRGRRASFSEGWEALLVGDATAARDCLAGTEDPPASFVLTLALLVLEQHEEACQFLEDLAQNSRDLDKTLAESGAGLEAILQLADGVFLPLDSSSSYLLIAYLLAFTYEVLGRTAEAGGILQQVSKNAGEVDAYEPSALTSKAWSDLLWADMLGKQAEWPEVVRVTDGYAAVSDPFAAALALTRGEALAQLGLGEAGIALADRVLKFLNSWRPTDPALAKKVCDPQYLQIWAQYVRGLSNQAEGKSSQASQDFQRVYSTNSRFRDVESRLRSLGAGDR